jgi:hypothetical protein
MGHHQAVTDAAKEARVALLAYSGVLGGPEADYRPADDHKVTEQTILARLIERGTVMGSAEYAAEPSRPTGKTVSYENISPSSTWRS